MRSLVRSLLQLALTVVGGALISASLIRFSPGFGTSEDQLDSRRSAATIHRILEERQGGSIAGYYVHFLAGYLRGDLGRSSVFERPVRDLVAERASQTIVTGSIGLGLALAMAILLSIGSLISKRISGGLVAITSGTLQCVPAGVLALCLFLLGMQGGKAAGLAVGMLVYPRVSQYLIKILGKASEGPHVLLARAKGLTEWRVLFVHVVPACTPQLLSLLGLSMALTVGAVIPVEAIMGVSGLGQLAWQAALARDSSLLVNLTVLMTLAITGVNVCLEAASLLLTPNREASV